MPSDKKDKPVDKPNIAHALFPPQMFVAVPESPDPPAEIHPRSSVEAAILQISRLPLTTFSHLTHHEYPYAPSRSAASLPSDEQRSMSVTSEEEGYNAATTVQQRRSSRLGSAADSVDAYSLASSHPVSLKVPQSSTGRRKSEVIISPDVESHTYSNDHIFSQLHEITTDSVADVLRGSEDMAPALQSSVSFGDSIPHLEEKINHMMPIMRQLQDEKEEIELTSKERLQHTQRLTKALDSLESEKLELMERNLQLSGQVERFTQARSVEGGTARIQISELEKQIKELKSVSERVNNELSRYQAKYREPDPKETLGLPVKGMCPPWLVNHFYLMPLVVSFEDRMKEKDAQLLSYEKRFLELQAKVEDVIRENHQLHAEKSTGKFIGVKTMEWQQLQEHAQLVLAENQVLIEQIEVLQNKVRDMNHAHVQEVSRLTRRLVATEADSRQADTDLADLRMKYYEVKKRYELETSGLEGSVPLAQHVKTVEEHKREYEALRGKSKADIEMLLQKLQYSDAEKSALEAEKLELKTDIASLENEVKAIIKIQKKWQKKASILDKKLVQSHDKERESHDYLKQLLKVTEQATFERDTYAQLAATQQTEKERTLSQLLEETQTQTKVEDKIFKQREKYKVKLDALRRDMLVKEKEFMKKESAYQIEIDHLKKLLQTQNNQSNKILLEKQEVERKLETVWSAATNDNKRLRESLDFALKKNTGEHNEHFDASLPVIDLDLGVDGISHQNLQSNIDYDY